MEFKNEPEVSLNSFFDLFGKYREKCNWNYQKAIQNKDQEQKINEVSSPEKKF